MASLSAAAAAAAAGGRVAAGDPRAVLHGAAIDSRQVAGRGELFFAFAGAQADGHRFVGDAFRRGAGGVVVQDLDAAAASWPALHEAAAAPGAVIQVADTFAALHAVARRVRERVPRRLVGITGSAGKTTTKELLAAMLGARFRVASSPGNFNNLYGFPLSLLNVPDDAEWMVAEMGMSTPGELRQLSLLGRPDVALFTVVRPAHLEFFDSLRGIAEAKAELLAGLAPDGLVVANAGDAEVVRIARTYAGTRRVIWYGLEAAAAAAAAAVAEEAEAGGVPPLDVAAYDIAPGPGGLGSRFVLAAGGERQAVTLALHGLYNVENCLAAAAVAAALGVPLPAIAAAAAAARPSAGRGVVHQVSGRHGRATVIDDSYNSNPDALEKALAGAAQLPAARRLAVLGDMLELGPEAARYHREGGRTAARLGFSPIAGVGELARELVAGALEGGAEADWCADAAAAAGWAAARLRADDVVLVKGSRGVGLDAVVRRVLDGAEAGGNLKPAARAGRGA
jgi:UDP-N-acetylmuramoyl-tripeptide--D-alanyl-D-alanine ligase